MRTGFGADPLEDDVGGRDRHHLAGVGIEGILAWQEGFVPHTAAALAHQLAMAVLSAGQVFTDSTSIGNHDTDKTHLDDGLVDHFHRGKQAVEVIGAFHQDLQLTSAQAFGVDKAIRHLEVVVIGQHVAEIRAHHRGDDLAGGQ